MSETAKQTPKNRRDLSRNAPVQNLNKMFIELFTHPLFIGVLGLKLILSALFISDSALSYIEFARYFAENPFSNPYQAFFTMGAENLLPHPHITAIILGIPFLLTTTLGISNIVVIDALTLRIPLLLADILILTILMSLLPKKKLLVLVLYWTCPIILYSNYVLGEIDLIPIALLFLSFYFLYHERIHTSAVLLALTLAAKTGTIPVIPFFMIYLATRKYKRQTLFTYITVFLLTYIASLLLFLSKGYVSYVFLAQAHLRIFDLAVPFSNGIFFYLTIAAYAYLLFKAITFRKLTRKILLMFTGVTFTLFVILINPPASWYVWPVPFLAYFFAERNNKNSLLYWGLCFLYTLYILSLPTSGLFSPFNLVNLPSPLIGIATANIGMNGTKLYGIIFTLLTAILSYIAYLMYNHGIKSSLLFQQRDGIPAIGIAGDSGGGKTSLAKSLTRLFGKEQVNVICGDDIHRWERGNPMWDRLTHLNPSSNRIHYHQNQMALMKKGKLVRRSKYDHQTGKFTKPFMVRPKEYIIDEGLHTFMVRRKNLYNLKLYLDPTPELRTYWKLKRDVDGRGYSEKKVMELIERRKVDSEKYISPQKQEADIIVSLKTKEDVHKLLKTKKGPKYYAEFWITSQLDIEPLIEKLTSKQSLSLALDYPNTSYQRIIVEGTISKEELFSILQELDIDQGEYGIAREGLDTGIDGILQILVLYCLDKNLLKKATGDLDNE